LIKTIIKIKRINNSKHLLFFYTQAYIYIRLKNNRTKRSRIKIKIKWNDIWKTKWSDWKLKIIDSLTQKWSTLKQKNNWAFKQANKIIKS